MSESKLGTVNCYSCDSNHQDMDLHEYKGQQPGPFTHWFTCPKTGDAVPLTVSTFMGTPIAVNQEMVMQLAAAEQSERGFLFAIAVPIENGDEGQPRVNLNRATVKFPHSHFAAAIKAFTDNLNKETGPPQTEPMKAAPLPDKADPMAQLFAPLRGNSDGK